MAKRGATSELNDRNWDDEEEPEEAGVFVQADEETLQNRVIKRAKRRVAGAGDGEAKASAFSGFGGLSGGATKSGAGFGGLKPSGGTGGFSAFQSMKPPASGGLGMFGSSGLSSSSVKPVVNGGGSSGNSNAASSLKKSGTSATDEGSWKDSQAYYSFLKSLNQSVLSWIKQHVEENPYIILTPVFKDYEKYMEKHKAENSLTTPSTTTTNTTTGATAQSPTSTLGAGSPLTTKTNGGTSTVFSSLQKDGEELSKNDTKSSDKPEASKGFGGFTFGSTAPKTTAVATLGTSGFTFGLSSTSTPSSLLGATAASTEKPTSSLATTTSAPSSGFSFGSASTTKATSGFSFGTSAAATTTASSGFSFGTSSTTTTAASSGFSFGFASKPAASSGAGGASSDTNGKNDDDDYVPPKPEVKEVKEDDALYSKRCKLYYQRNEQWVDRGVGNIHLKPVADNKTQILIRADTNLGNILLNVMLASSMPVSRQGKNNVFLVCVPNPPLDLKASSDDEAASKPVPMLVRVKTEQDADELFKHIDDRKKLLS